MNKKQKVIYRISLGVFLFIISVSMIMPFKTGSYERLGYPSFLMYILPVLKISGLVAILSNRSKKLSEWAFSGFTLLLLLAIFSHIMVGDHIWPVPAIALLALTYVYYYQRKLKPQLK